MKSKGSFEQIHRSATVGRRQQGFIVADFIFSMTLAAGMGILLFSLSYSLAVVEVTQYVSFSVARAQVGSNKSPDEQAKKAQDKYVQYASGKGAIGMLYQGDWFKLGKTEKLDIRSGQTGNGKTFSEDLAGGADKRPWFIGVSFPLTIGLLKFKFPFLGDTAPDSDGGLATKINTMLIREPSERECKDFMEQRRSALKALPSGQQFFDTNAYFPMEDNGC